MTTHKIPGISKDICNAEQMMAYNYCHDYYNLNGGIDLALKHIRANTRLSRYNVDLICRYVERNLRAFRNERYHIFSSYEQIGQFFTEN